VRVVKAFPVRFRDGVRLFNGGRYFEAHEAFEESLDELETDPRWEFALALVQVAVGYHKWTSGHPGAARMLGLGAEKLAAFPPDAWGIDLEALRKRLGSDVVAADHGAICNEPPRIVAV
jgi:predicted metal-dependent hydrolase